MASGYKENPFADEEINPFANSRGAPQASNSQLSPLPHEPVDYDHSATVDIPLGNSQDLKKREKEFLAREAELKKREEELQRKEDAIKRAGIVIEENNWPPFFPVIHHDIANEIPIHLQRLQYVAFTTYLGIVLCLCWNFVAVTCAWLKGEGVTIWFLAIIYLISGVPGAYVFWYQPLYRAMRTDSAIRFGQFFVCYSVNTEPGFRFFIIHIGFCVVAAIAPPIFFKGKSLTGMLPALEVLTDSIFVGIFYLVGFVLFCIESLISIWVIQRPYSFLQHIRAASFLLFPGKWQSGTDEEGGCKIDYDGIAITWHRAAWWLDLWALRFEFFD
nr:secretory carrier-associated membrane protein 1-like [Ipomoea batatas]